MAIEITIPRLGWSMDEGIFGEWLIQDGECVKAGDPIFTLESEKALQEVESVDSGILKLVVDAPQSGEVVEVGLLVGWLLEEGEDAPGSATRQDSISFSASESSEAEVRGSATEAGIECAAQEPVSTQTLDVQRTPKSGSRNATPAVSPRAKRVAMELDVDWTKLTGSGSSGRIHERDVRAAASDSGSAICRVGQPLTATRRTIAARMKHSLQQTAPVTLTTKIDATSLVSLRTQLKADEAPAGATDACPTFNDIVIKLVAKCLQRHPGVYAQWIDDALVQPAAINIGLAVETDEGLKAPVIRDVPSLSLRKVAAETRRLIERARSRQLAAAEMSGGVFSISNLGAYGIDAFTPIINHPETAILGLGAIRREAVVDAANQIVARDQVTLSITFDHRVLDGAPAARFLQTLGGAIENAAAWLID